jgi:REP element-mobilizing transposase RayT
MARPLRLDYPGAWHHVMHRGARRAPIFRDDAHCLLWLEAARQAVERFGIEIHAWSLMPNHYHMLVRSPLGSLSRAMRHLNAVYTQRVNGLHRWDGPVFRGRFRSRLVEDERYQRYLMAYIHLNPVRARLVGAPDEQAWTSYRQLAGLEPLSSWLSTGARDHLFGTVEQMHAFVRELQLGHAPWPDDLLPAFALAVSAAPARPASPAAPPASRPDTQAILARVREITGASQADLRHAAQGRSANPARRFAALMLMREAATTDAEVGRALAMTAKQVANLRYRAHRQPLPEPLAAWRALWDRGGESQTESKK